VPGQLRPSRASQREHRPFLIALLHHRPFASSPFSEHRPFLPPHAPRRSTQIPALPQDLFMIMRTITLLRGLLSSLQVIG
jgi:hypothetical protein